MKRRLLIPALTLVVFLLGSLTALASENPLPGSSLSAAASRDGIAGAQELLDGTSVDSLPDNQEMFNYITSFVEQTKNLPPEQAAATAPLEFGKAYDTIGTFDNWTMWIGWNGSFSDTYAPESESYAWVVYFAPEGAYVALQSGKANYSAVNVFGSIGYFWGALASPDGAVLRKQYIEDLLGVSISWAMPLNLVPYGPLANLGMGFEKGLTFFRLPGSSQLKRGIQYNGGFTVSYDLVPMPDWLPGISLDYESKVDAGFYPIIDWSNMNTIGDTPVNIVEKNLRKVATTDLPGNTFVELMAKEFANKLLPFFSRLKTSGTVVIKDTDLPTTAQFFGHFLQNNSVTVPASSPKPTVDYMIRQTSKWLATGDTGNLSGPIEQGMEILADPPETFKQLGAGTGLGFEMAYKHASVYYNYSWAYCDTVKKINCVAGKTCAVSVPAAEIAALVPGSTASQFEGATVWFNTPAENFLASGSSWIGVEVNNGKAVFKFLQSGSEPALIGPEVDKSALTGNKTLKLCRRVVSVSSGLPTVTVLATDPTVTEAGDKGRFTIKRTGSTTEDLVVKFDVGGSAISGKDYKTFSESRKIPAGSDSVVIYVSAFKDTLNEPAETVIIRLSKDATYEIGLQSQAKATIAKNP